MKFSIIVPVYRRPDEIQEFLSSLAAQTDHDFEVLIMEGPSDKLCKNVCDSFANKLSIRYVLKDSSRSDRRNEGMRMASGDYLLLFDSDVILPKDYIAIVRRSLTDDYVDCFGGPDSADQTFSDIQLAVNYAMTSVMTTGGIRGATKKVDKFLPRAFNMGLSKKVFETIGGYREMIGEDVDLSMRIKEGGFSVRLIPEAYVYHKRRVNLKKFYKQVNTFGKARILLTKLHPGSLKIMHLFPSVFVIGNVLLVLLAIVFRNLWWISPLGLYVFAIFVESLLKNKSLKIALMSIVTSYAQLFGYGLGLINELFTHKAEKQAAESLYRQ